MAVRGAGRVEPQMRPAVVVEEELAAAGNAAIAAAVGRAVEAKKIPGSLPNRKGAARDSGIAGECGAVQTAADRAMAVVEFLGGSRDRIAYCAALAAALDSSEIGQGNSSVRLGGERAASRQKLIFGQKVRVLGQAVGQLPTRHVNSP